MPLTALIVWVPIKEPPAPDEIVTVTLSVTEVTRFPAESTNQIEGCVANVEPDAMFVEVPEPYACCAFDSAAFGPDADEAAVEVPDPVKIGRAHV